LLARTAHAARAREQWFTAHSQTIFIVCLIPFLVDTYLFRRSIPLHEGVAIALMIGATVVNPTMLAGRILEMNYPKTTGLMSYSIYLWQQFLFRENWGQLAFVLLPTAAILSWRLIEQPCIRLGKRLNRSKRELTSPLVSAVADISPRNNLK
jgi:peptidoglycan/LPS O-acetylase OafA/YrhL